MPTSDRDRGSNPIASSVHFWSRGARPRRRAGARLAVHRPAPHRDGRPLPRARGLALLPGADGAGAGARRPSSSRRLARPRLPRARRLGAGRSCASAHCSVAGRARGGRCAASRVEQLCRAPGARLGTTRPAAIRLNYGMQRTRGGGKRGAPGGAAALPDRRPEGPWRRHAAVVSNT
jgi:hypothetical protein